MKSGAKNIIRLALGRAGSTEGLLLAEVFLGARAADAHVR